MPPMAPRFKIVAPMATLSAAPRPSQKRFWTLSFSGAGHLLPYHLGVASALLEGGGCRRRRRTARSESGGGTGGKVVKPFWRDGAVGAVAGSSSGAIAATVLALFPHRLDEYADRFLHDRGGAYRTLEEMMLEEPLPTTRPTGGCGSGGSPMTGSADPASCSGAPPLLVIAVTRCSDGAPHLLSFGPSEDGRTDGGRRRPAEAQQVLRAVRASCLIPRSFHPVDMIPSHSLSYPEDEGVRIGGVSYVDGGISAPSPPTPLDSHSHCRGRVVVSPISGGGTGSVPRTAAPRTHAGSDPPTIVVTQIRPADLSAALPFVLTARCGTFQIRPSVQNLRALVVAMGVTASPEVLRDWHDRGVEDALSFMSELEETTR